MGMPGIGKTDLFQTISSGKDFWSYIYPKKEINFLVVFVDVTKLLNLTPKAFYNLLLGEIYRKSKTTKHSIKDLNKIKEIYNDKSNVEEFLDIFGKIEDILGILTKTNDLKVLILIDDFATISGFDTQFFNSLKALRNINKSMISLGFSSDQDLKSSLDPDKLDDLWVLFLNQIFWLHPLKEKESIKIMQNWNCERNCKLTQKAMSSIYTLAKGHVGYMRALERVYQDNQLELFDNLEELCKENPVKSRSDKFWKKLIPKYRSFLSKYINDKTIKVNSRGKYLKRTGILNEKGEIFSPLLEKFIKSKMKEVVERNNNETLLIKEKTVYINETPINDQPTKNEFKILHELYKHKGNLLDRNKIAESLWGENKVEDYSDWAIDRTISRLRKKLGDSAQNPRFLHTVKGRGYKLTI